MLEVESIFVTSEGVGAKIYLEDAGGPEVKGKLTLLTRSSVNNGLLGTYI
jgi:hypothetical protein